MFKLAYKIDVFPNTKGVLFRQGKVERILDPGVHTLYAVEDTTCRVAIIDAESRSVVLNNQEVLSKDHIAFRLGFVVQYRITDFTNVTKLLNFQSHGSFYWMVALDARVFQEIQVAMNLKVAGLESEAIFADPRSLEMTPEECKSTGKHLEGIELESVRVREVSFPKMIQELFAKKLEARIRAQTELENARTTTATARALKNAAALINDDPGLKFLVYLESLEKLSAKGKNTFIIGRDGENLPITNTKA